MVEKKDVIAFFDRLAPGWDADQTRSDEIISIILDNAGVRPGADVLDVATGTGVLIPDYLARGAASVTGIDISPNMARIAREKFPQPQVTILCGDAEEARFDKAFDCIVIFNAFPHFPQPRRLVEALQAHLKPGGILTIAHGSSREEIDSHHERCASGVSLGLMPAEDLAKLLAEFLDVECVVSNDRMYQVAARKRA